MLQFETVEIEVSQPKTEETETHEETIEVQFEKPQEVIKLCQFDQTSTALIKLFREKQVCDFNL